MSIDVTPAPVTVVLVSDETNVVVDAAPAVVALLPAPVVVPVVPSVVEIVVAAPGVPGAPGPPGPRGGLFTVMAGETINPLTVVYLDADGFGHPASSMDLEPDRILGLSRTGALAGELVSLVSGGELVGTHGLPLTTLYLGVDGSLTPDQNTGLVRLRVAAAPSPAQLIIRFGPTTQHALGATHA